jgi:hypothetical protein
VTRVHIDDDELHRLELDLRRAPFRIQWGLTQTLKTVAGPIVSREMRRDARGHQGNYFGRPGTSYETPLEQHVSSEMIKADTLEVGIEKSGAGKLAHIIVFGSVNNAPVYDHMAGPRRALPRVVKALGDEAEDDVLG